MAASREILSSSLSERSPASILPSSASRFLLGTGGGLLHRRLCVRPSAPPAGRSGRCRSSFSKTSPAKETARNPLVKAVAPLEPEQFKVRASVTIRKKTKEDVKDAVARHWDGLSDLVGWNVILQLISEELDPSTATISIPFKLSFEVFIR